MKLNIKKEGIEDKLIKNSTQIKEINEKLLKLTATIEQIAKILVKQKTKIAEIETNLQNSKVKNLETIDKLIDAVKNEIKETKREEKIEAIDIDFITQKVIEKLDLNNEKEKKSNSNYLYALISGVFTIIIIGLYFFLRH